MHADAADCRRCLVINGPPGVGKTSAVRMLLGRYHSVAHFGVRSFALRMLGEGRAQVQAMRPAVLASVPLPDSDVRQLFALFLDSLPDSVGAIIVEGYPRNARQFRDLLAELRRAQIELIGQAVIEVSDEVALRRASRRTACISCGEPSLPSGSMQTCHSCGGLMARRDDDNADFVGRRLRDYRLTQAQLRKYFGACCSVYEISGANSPGEICAGLGRLMGIQPSAEIHQQVWSPAK
jgi:adenylate kinase family enzyme